MALNVNGDLRIAKGTLDDTTIANHYRKKGNWSGRKAEKFGYPQLHEIVRTTTIDKDGEAVMVNSAVDMESFRGGHPRHHIQAQVRGVIHRK